MLTLVLGVPREGKGAPYVCGGGDLVVSSGDSTYLSAQGRSISTI